MPSTRFSGVPPNASNDILGRGNTGSRTRESSELVENS